MSVVPDTIGITQDHKGELFRTAIRRWSAFNAVGLLGMLVQLLVVAVLLRILGGHYLIATAFGVEAAILHNFIWHQRWTWRDRPADSPQSSLTRLLHFHLVNGVVSLVGNVGVTVFCTGLLGLHPIAANLVAIAACSFVNFAAGDKLVFQSSPRERSISLPLVVVAVLLPAHSAEAGPRAATLAAWRAYETQVDTRYNAGPSGDNTFFALDRQAQARGWRGSIRRGQPTLIEVDAPGIEDGKIHHWIGAIFVPDLRVQTVVDRIQQNAGHESEHYEDVLASRLLERDGDRLRLFLKIRRTNLITVTYNTEHSVQYRRIGPMRISARSVATRIAELANVGTPQEREKAADDDNGFLWRLNAYWRYEGVPGGVIVECESVSLSRPVPMLLRPVANPIVDRVARESLNRTLIGLRTMLTGK